MKITKLEVLHYVAPNMKIAYKPLSWNLLKVSTDEGIVGYGEPILEGRARTVATAVHELGDYIIGKDPRDIERLWQDMYKGSFYRGGPILASAVSGVEQALWDITGKWYGVPVYKLLGGAVRDKIRVYSWVFGEKDEDYVEGALDRQRKGFNAMKMLACHEPLRYIETPAKVGELADRVGKVRQAVGKDFDIAIDLHGRFSPAMAKLYIKEVEQYSPMFIEEAILPGNHDVMADIARSTHIPLATGERLFGRWGYRDVIEKRAATILQPDVCHCGGILELKKIAAMGEVNYCAVAPHNPMGPVAFAASLQCDAGTINFLIQEQSHMGEGVLKEPFVQKDGFVDVPTKPGLGIEIDEEKFSQLLDDGSGHLDHWYDPDDGSFSTW